MSDSSTRQPSATLALGFSCVGHFLFHYFAAMYFTIVLALSKDWSSIGYESLIALWTPAAIMIGLFALPCGRLADKWSSPGMMIIMFLGMGAMTAACGFATETVGLTLLLAGIGLFGAIYHPVGVPWLIRTAGTGVGMKLAVNGVFGGLGAAAAGGATGLLIDFFGWREAFIVPGVFCFGVGGAMFFALKSGRISNSSGGAASSVGGSDGRGNLAAFMALLFPMFAIGLVYNTTQAAMPKLFEEGMATWLGGDIVKVGLAVTVVYVIGAAMQMLGGILADRYPLKHVYALGWAIQAPMLFVMAATGDMVLFLAAVFLVVGSTSTLPSENIMLSRFAPAAHQGLAFGIKFVLAFGAAPLGVWLIKLARDWTGDFSGLMIGLGATATAALAVVLILPNEPAGDPAHTPKPMPAE